MFLCHFPLKCHPLTESKSGWQERDQKPSCIKESNENFVKVQITSITWKCSLECKLFGREFGRPSGQLPLRGTNVFFLCELLLCKVNKKSKVKKWLESKCLNQLPHSQCSVSSLYVFYPHWLLLLWAIKGSKRFQSISFQIWTRNQIWTVKPLHSVKTRSLVHRYVHKTGSELVSGRSWLRTEAETSSGVS